MIFFDVNHACYPKVIKEQIDVIVTTATLFLIPLSTKTKNEELKTIIAIHSGQII